jgi:hypothetical protein
MLLVRRIAVSRTFSAHPETLLMSLVLVKGRPRSWQTFALTAFGLGLLVLGIVLGLEARRGAVVISLAGGVLLTMSEIVVRFRRSRCRWVEDLGDGFQVIDQFGERDYQDTDVTDISHYQFERHSQGLLSGVRRHFVVWLSGNEQPIEMVNEIAVHEPDPLDAMIDRITTRLHERAEEQLASGSHIEGDNWRLDRWGIAQRESLTGAIPEELPLDELSGIDLAGHELRIWRKRQEQVAMRIPIASRNAHLLYLLLDARVVEAEPPPPQAPREGLGRLLFELGYQRRTRICVSLAIAAAAATGLLVWSGRDVAQWVAGATTICAVGFIAMANFYRKAVLRCYEFGIFQTGMLRDRQLQYDQITTLNYCQTRQFYRSEYTLFKSVYTGTSVSIRFDAAPDSSLRSITYGTTLQRPDENIERLRDRVAEHIADLMEGFLKQGQPIHWTTKITLHPDGIEYTPQKFIGRRSTLKLPYEFIGHYAVVETAFAIWQDVTDAPLVEEPTSQPNFYAGLVLFERLMDRRSDSLAMVDAEEQVSDHDSAASSF